MKKICTPHIPYFRIRYTSTRDYSPKMNELSCLFPSPHLHTTYIEEGTRTDARDMIASIREGRRMPSQLFTFGDSAGKVSWLEERKV